jgi:hypothetical protein
MPADMPAFARALQTLNQLNPTSYGRYQIMELDHRTGANLRGQHGVGRQIQDFLWRRWKLILSTAAVGPFP